MRRDHFTSCPFATSQSSPTNETCLMSFEDHWDEGEISDRETRQKFQIRQTENRQKVTLFVIVINFHLLLRDTSRDHQKRQLEIRIKKVA